MRNPRGNPISLRRRSGQTITLAYDDLDRLSSRSYADSADNRSYGYDLLGRRLSANLPNVAGGYNMAYTWDNAGRLTSTTAGGRTLAYQYDAAGNRTRITWPDTSFYVTTAYDALNRPTLVKENGSTNLADLSNYDDLSRPKTVALGNGTASSYAYGSHGALSSLNHDLAGTAQDLSVGYTRNWAQGIASQNWSSGPTAKAWT